MNNLKIGDKVRCLGNRNVGHVWYTNRVYTVLDTYKAFGHDYVSVTSESGVRHNIREHRFVKVGE